MKKHFKQDTFLRWMGKGALKRKPCVIKGLTSLDIYKREITLQQNEGQIDPCYLVAQDHLGQLFPSIF